MREFIKVWLSLILVSIVTVGLIYGVYIYFKQAKAAIEAGVPLWVLGSLLGLVITMIFALLTTLPKLSEWWKER